MDRVPNEILDRIIDELCAPVIPLSDFHPNDVLQLSRVNCRFYALASPVLAKKAADIKKANKMAPTILGTSKHNFESVDRAAVCVPTFLDFVIALPKGCWPWAMQNLSGPDVYLCNCTPSIYRQSYMMKICCDWYPLEFTSFRVFSQAESLPQYIFFVCERRLYDLRLGIKGKIPAAVWFLLRHVFPRLKIDLIQYQRGCGPDRCISIEWEQDRNEDEQGREIGRSEEGKNCHA